MRHPFPTSTRSAIIVFVVGISLFITPLWSMAAAARPKSAVRSAARKTVSPESLFVAPAASAQAAANTGARVDGNAPSAVNIVATKVDSFTDADGDNKAEPGQVITYDVTITNNGDTDATAVVFNDTVDTNTTLVPNSVNTQPIAVADAFNVLGNVRIQVPDGASDLLANDCDPDNGAGCSNTGLTITSLTGAATDNSLPFSVTTANGSNVTAAAADGSFQYNPAPGFEGTDTFTYTIRDAGVDNVAGNADDKTDTATVTLTVAGMIFFVDDNAAGGGDGRLTNPFNCFVGTSCFDDTTADQAGDNIFLFDGAYTGGQTLLNNQKLIGQGTSNTTTLAALAGVTVPAHSDPLPALSNNPANVSITTAAAATNAITLGSGNTLRGFTVGNTTGAKIFGNNFGTLTVGNSTTPDVVLGGTGQALNLTLGSFAATSAFNGVQSTSSAGTGVTLSQVAGTVVFGSTQITNSTAQGILVGQSTVNINFGNTTIGSATANSGGTDAISLSNNSGGTRTFGAITIQNNTAVGFLHAVGGGATTITGATSITNPGTLGIDIQDSTTALSFQNATVNGSGGTGVFLDDNTGAISFLDLDIAPDANQRGLHATDQTTGALTTTSGTITTTGATAVEVNNASGTAPLNIQLTTVNANGGTNGIKLFNTSSSGSPGGFRVLGNSSGNCGGTTGGTPTAIAIASNPADCTGGDIRNTTGTDQTHNGSGVSLTNAASVSLTRVRIRDNGSFGIRGTGGNGFTLTNSLIDGVNGNVTGGSFPESAILFDNLGGTASITNSNVRGGFAHNIKVDNQTSTLNLTITGCNIRDTHASTNGDDGITLEAETTANLTAVVNQNVLANHGGDHCNVTAINNAILNITFNNNTATGGHVSGIAQTGIFIFGSNYDGGAPAQDLTYQIQNNNISGNASGGLIHVNKGAGTATFGGTITGNTLTNSAASSGIRVEARGAGGAHNAIVNNNTITNVNNIGILFEAGEGSAAINGTASGNNISAPGGAALHGMYANIGVLAADTNQACMDWSNNTLTNAANEANGGADIRLRQRFGTQIRLPGYAGDGAGAAIPAYMTGTKANAATTITPSSTAANFTGGAACTQPTAPPPMTEDTGRPSGDSDEVNDAAAPQSATSDGGITSRPFVSFPQASKQTTATAPVAAQRTAQPQAAATTRVVSRTSGPNATTGGSLPVNVGTLRPGDSVTITFQVTVNSASTLAAGTTQVSNQGTVSGSNFSSVQTDDTAVAGTNNPTVTPIDFASISVGNVMVAEGATGVRTVTVTLTLNQATNSATSVQYQTTNGTATAPDDYTSVGLTTVNIPANASSASFTVQVVGDIIREGNHDFFIDLSNATGNSAILDNQATVTIADDEPQVADISGDGFTDAAIWNSNNGQWFVVNSGTTTATLAADDWGRASLGDVAVPGDYDGDNKIDIAIFRVSEGNWYILQSSGAQPNIRVENWGQSGDKPVPGDYDNDGKTDVSVWRTSEGKWYIKNSNGGTTAQNWGISTDKPVVGDFDGDGKSDLAVFRGSEGNWYILNSSTGANIIQNWGLGTDTIVPGDYDGDGRTDMAVYRSGTWFIRNSNGGSTVKSWGNAADLPVPGDYDGDGKFDISVWRSTEGNFYTIRSTDNTVLLQTIQVGGAGVVPVPNAYLPQ